MLLALGCGGGDGPGPGPTAPGRPGTLELSVSTVGVDLDPDGYTARVGFESRFLDLEATVTWQLSAGQHRLELEDVAPNCALPGENPRTVQVSAGSVTRVSLEIGCSELPDLRGKILFRRGDDLFVIEPDGSGVQQITNTPDDPESNAEISPDGKRIVFHRFDEGAFTVRSDGGEERRIGSGANPTWSPDGQRIAYRNVLGSQTDIWITNADGSDAVKVTDDAAWDDFPSWSTASDEIAFFRSPTNDLYVMNVDGSGLRQVTDDEDAVIEWVPRWSPDGSKIVFGADDGEIYVVNADGTGLKNLSNHSEIDDEPAWSPDGSKIVFVSNRDNVPNISFDIFVMNADGSDPTNLNVKGISPYWGR